MTCYEGDNVRFKAVLTGDPDPEVTWLVNGIPLTESEKVRFISEDGICIVIINDVSRHFDGMVTCQVSGVCIREYRLHAYVTSILKMNSVLFLGKFDLSF